MRRYLKIAALSLLVLGIGVTFAASNVGGKAPTIDASTTSTVNARPPDREIAERIDRSEVPESQSPADSRPEARSELGAQAAAVRFLELTEDVVSMSPERGAALQRSISTTAAASELAGELADTLVSLRAEVPDGVGVDVAPVAVSSIERDSGWDVSIWYVEVIVYGDQLAVEQWRTATYTMEWEDGGWRMSALDSVHGPTPVRGAATIASPTIDLISITARMGDEVLEP